MKLHFTAAEPSGDLLAREVIEAITASHPDAEITGIGGAEMARLGITSPIDTAPLSVLGLVEGLKAYPAVIKLADAAADHIISCAPDVAVLVDSWGFTLRVGQRVRARAPHIRLVKLVGPQVWATRAGRAKTLAASFDQVLCLHTMELPFYDDLDIAATAIGNPALARDVRGDGDAFRAAHGLRPDAPVLLVLPGSRASEIANVAPALMDAAARVKAARTDVQIVAAPASNIADQFCAALAGNLSGVTLSRDGNARYDAMAAADLALACSGTVTSELAVQGTPMIVAYKVGWITWMVAKHLLYKPTHITLLNIAAGDIPVVPEFVQGDMEPSAIAACALEKLSDTAQLAAQTSAQNDALIAMGQGARPAAQLAAEAIVTGV